jgi:hypothetical protein
MSSFIEKYPVVSSSGQIYEVTVVDYCGDSGIKSVDLYKYEDVENIFGKVKRKRIFLKNTLVCTRIVSIIYSIEKLVAEYEKEQNGDTFEQQNLKEFEDWDGVIK